MNDNLEKQASAPLNESSNQTITENVLKPKEAQPTQPKSPSHIQTVNEVAAPPPISLPQPKPKSSKSRKGTIIALIIIVIIFSISVFIYWLFSNKQLKQTQTATEQKQFVSKEGPSETINNTVDANNHFALSYYFRLKDKKEGNVFYSPFSISSALAMTYEGAKGQTAEEMVSVFHFPKDNELRRSEYEKAYTEINRENKKYELKTANALWVQEDYQFFKDYLDTIGKHYNGNATNLNFKNDQEGSRITINSWVEEQTNDKIKDLIPKGAIDSLTRLILTNAIYFKGEWVKQFNEEDTRDENFRISKNNSIKVPMMRRTDGDAKFNYTENNELQILKMPYSGEKLSMLILLPKSDDLKALENLLNKDNLTEWKRNLENQRVNVYIPKFKFETKYMMADDLKAMGMPTAFMRDAANFSGMADFSKTEKDKNLYIGNVIHKAFIEVNEEGTEAAAATALIMIADGTALPNQNAPKIPVFRADHPFIFIIQENTTGNILFIGRVVNPTLNI